MGDTEQNGVQADVQDFITNQNRMNTNVIAFMDLYRTDKVARDKQQSDTLALLKQLLERNNDEPPTKKIQTNPDEATSGSSGVAAANEAILGSKTVSKDSPPEAISGSGEQTLVQDEVEVHVRHDQNKTLMDDELDLFNQLATGEQKDPLEEDQEEHDLNNLSEEQVEEYLLKEYSDALSQTEEKFGPPVSQVVGILCEKIWGRVILSQDKKKAMQEGINVPQNCKSLKAPVLNPPVHIRVHDNTRKKDDAAKWKQANMSRVAIPLLYALGEMDKTKQAMEGQPKFLSLEPRNFEEAKKVLKVIKGKNEIALQGIVTGKAKVTKSFQLLNYYNTEATRKRKQDICDSLGSAFKPYGLETVAPTKELFDEEQMKRMKSELKAIKPKVELPKNGASSTKSRRSGSQNQGKNSNHHKSSSGNSYSNYNNNQNNYNGGNSSGSGQKKQYPKRKGGKN